MPMILLFMRNGAMDDVLGLTEPSEKLEPNGDLFASGPRIL